MKEKTLILITGGGSGGHVTPLKALYSELKDNRGLQVAYIGCRTDETAKNSFKGLDMRQSYIFGGKFRRYSNISLKVRFKIWRQYIMNLRDLAYVLIGTMQAVMLLLRRRPGLIFSKGGYPALPVCIAARVLRIKLITHDSDAVAGLSHRFVAKYATQRLFGVPLAEGVQDNWFYVGVPLADKYYDKPQPDSSLVSEGKQIVLVTGGGLGSRDTNAATLEIADELINKHKNVEIHLVAGEPFYEEAKSALEDLSNKRSVVLYGFSDRLYDLSSLADVVVTRAGATALSEMAILAKPIVLIPNPQLTGSHQLHNAAIYRDSNAAILVDDSGSSIDRSQLFDALDRLLSSKIERHKLSKNISKLASKHTSTKLVASHIVEAL